MDERDRWKQGYLAKAAYCEWAAKMIDDDQYKEYLEALAIEWKRGAEQEPAIASSSQIAAAAFPESFQIEVERSHYFSEVQSGRETAL
jgi:hypothetical protein